MARASAARSPATSRSARSSMSMAVALIKPGLACFARCWRDEREACPRRWTRMTVSTAIEDVPADVPGHIREIWNQAELVKTLSDGLIRIGPWGLGLDGLLAFLPGANLVYGLGAGGVLVWLAIKAEASKGT